MISFILIHNRQGKIRLAKWFTTSILEQEKQRIKLDVHRLVASRDQKSFSNFIEYKEKKIIYKRYAGLYFSFCVDLDDNELGCLESIHFFVEILDAYFKNFYKVYAILDELFLAGEIQETSKKTILQRLELIDRLG